MPNHIDGEELFFEVGCTKEMKDREKLWKEAQRKRARHDAPAWRETARTVNGFGFRLLKECGAENENIIASPFSVQLALGMVLAGAQGDTLTAMARVLGMKSEERTPRLQALGDLAEILLFESGLHPYKLNIANRAWFQKGLPFRPDYRRILEEIFRVTPAECDFEKGDLGAIRNEINQWVRDQTNGKVPEILPPGSPDAMTRLILVNAVHFLARWQFPFEKEATEDLPFHPPGGDVVRVPTMRKTHEFPYHETPRFQAVELPYEGRTIGMTLFLPAKNRSVPELEEELLKGGLEESVKGFDSREVILQLPRFHVEWGDDLNTVLRRMGMEEAFGDRARFMEILDGPKTPTEGGLKIGQVIHRARIDVEEEKTEAAAVTAVCLAAGACAPPEDPPEPVRFIADRPFLFMIRDRTTGVVLFQGRLFNPAS